MLKQGRLFCLFRAWHPAKSGEPDVKQPYIPIPPQAFTYREKPYKMSIIPLHDRKKVNPLSGPYSL